MSVPLFPLYGYPLAKAAQICQREAEWLSHSHSHSTTVIPLWLTARQGGADCQRVAERLRPSSGGVLGGNECTTVPLYGYPLAKMEQICQRVAERLRPSSGGVLGRNERTTVSLLRLPSRQGGSDLPAGSGEALSQQPGSVR
jgi:hypothetical protein